MFSLLAGRYSVFALFVLGPAHLQLDEFVHAGRGADAGRLLTCV